jgi:dihydroneopterin aldolase
MKSLYNRGSSSFKGMTIKEYNIELRDIHMYAYHGVMQQEREIGAWYTIDMTLRIDDHSCAISDDITGTVSYADVYEIISNGMKTPSMLLENVCNRIIENIYTEFEKVAAITMTLSKDTPPMGGDRMNAAVTLKTERE